MAKEKKMKTTDHFSADFIEEMKQTLLAEQEKVQAELGKFTHKNPNADGDFDADFPEFGDEEDDNVQEVQAYAVNKALEETLEKKLRDINAALKRMDENTYGICKYTGEPIDERRLRARPTSSSSVAAKKVLTNEA